MSSGRCIAASSEIGENERVLGCVNQTLRRIAGSDGTLPLPERRARVLDLLGAIVLAMVGLRYASSDSMSVEKYEVVGPGRVVIDGLMASSASTGTVIAITAAAMPLALRRRFPLGVLWVVMFSSALMRQQSPDVVFYACVLCSVAVYSAATYSPKRLATIITLPLAAAVLVALFKHASLPVLPHKYVALLVMIPLIVAAYGLRGWVHRVDEARDRLARSEALQWQALEHAVAAERARIARDLHDVVTHNVSMMVIQAGAARTVLDRSPEQAREALIAVESGGRAALSELRHVMGLLAPDAGGADAADPAALEPQPGLRNVDELVRSVRAAGLPTELTVHGSVNALPSGVDLTAYEWSRRR
ncbi:MAG: hypothetical protein JWN39_4429 [Ilumatobacteraceae bacterium]|nr:hypothetical protein [Ilumatobacteraceae bacterium]